MAIVRIKFNGGKEYISAPITVGMEKRLARFSRDTWNDSVKAAELQMKASELGDQESTDAVREALRETMSEYNAAMERLEGMQQTRNEIIVQVFGGQFTLDEFENNCPREEAVRVIQELQGTTKGIIEKNV